MAQPSSDRLTSADSAEALNFLILETGEKTANPNMLNSQDAAPIDHSVALGSVGYHKSGYVANAYSSKAPSVYIGSYDNTDGKQGTYVPFVNNEALDNGSHGIHNKPSSVAFHGYEYSPQMVHKSCVPVTTQFFARDHGHLYNARQYSTSDPFCFQQSISPNSSYSISPAPVSQEKLPVHIDLQRNSKRSGLRASYSSPLRSSGREGNYFGNSGGPGLLHQGFEGSEVGGLSSHWSNASDGNNYMLQLSSTPASLKSLGSLELSQDDFGPASQQKGSLYGFGSCSGSSYTSYSHQRMDPTSDYGSVSASSIEMDGQSWPTLNEVRHGRRCNDFSCSCAVTFDMLSERNRGPRAFKPKIRTMLNGSAVDNSKNSLIDDIVRDSYNRLDFVTNYKDAMFFIIKSYSEDNVHKSIKYGVWASTPNGNKKLDSAYCEAKEKETCPIFLFFSVNASAQFCGVAEMVGPVDFHKNVDYWLQDKWSGQFPVKWHIIKDVPNSQFRHILLENNDNKPVTNSRDTQEVEMEQGIEMLNIFKNYGTYSSILDDFYFYEQRQKAMQERKSGQQATQVAPQVVVRDEQLPVSLSTDSIKKMSKSFAEAMSLTKNEKEHSAVGKVISPTTASVAYGN